MRGGAILLLLVLLAPGAAACSWGPPPLGHVLAWTDGERALTNREHAWGVLRLEDDAFTPLRDFAPMPGPRAVASGDGRHLAFVEADGVGGTCELMRARLIVLDTATRGELRLLDHEPHAIAGAGDRLAIATGTDVRLVPWTGGDPTAAWTLPEGARHLAAHEAAPRLLAASVTGAWLLLEDGEVRPLDTRGSTRLHALAFSPDGAHAAALEGDGVDRRLLVWRLADGALVATRTNLSYATPLAWSDAGILVAGMDQQQGEFRAWVRVFDNETLHRGWSATLGEGSLGMNALPTAEGDGFLLGYDGDVVRIEPGSFEALPPGEAPPPVDDLPPPTTPPPRDVPLAGIPALALVLVAAALARRRR